ncbi:nucleotidyltransferase [Tabrizicola sp. TH137]|uniref:nucleotidyltransferase family protein n=1 Tax=Tabrizicola sp. TH137 TaxID=2067452 RepID=UPI000C7D380A|nr:nucleotidyltransferase family protein [Tabrizicola sp. TH137]PLL14706.1 nucleotidyltransferase [Tabrizicola sp. TH137]
MRPSPPPLMLFAAGVGTRMGSLTATRPKPLIEVAGRALIDHAIALADAAGIGRIVANSHYLPDQIEAHLAPRGIAVSREAPVILETGGGLKRALPLLGGSPVLTLNTDAVWTGRNPLVQLLEAWDDRRMDGLLLLLPVAETLGHGGTGDFVMDDEGRLERAKGRSGSVYLGAQIVKTEGLAGIADEAFSLNLLWDRMIAEGRLYGVIHQGGWCDVGRPEGIALAEEMLRSAT